MRVGALAFKGGSCSSPVVAQSQWRAFHKPTSRDQIDYCTTPDDFSPQHRMALMLRASQREAMAAAAMSRRGDPVALPTELSPGIINSLLKRCSNSQDPSQNILFK